MSIEQIVTGEVKHKNDGELVNWLTKYHLPHCQCVCVCTVGLKYIYQFSLACSTCLKKQVFDNCILLTFLEILIGYQVGVGAVGALTSQSAFLLTQIPYCSLSILKQENPKIWKHPLTKYEYDLSPTCEYPCIHLRWCAKVIPMWSVTSF